MSYAPFPSNDGSELHDPARSASLRLRDAEKIAANRLDGGGDGSLKDALASVIASGVPRDDLERLTDRIGAAQAAYTTPSDAPTLPFLGERPNFGFGGEPTEHTLLGLPEWGEARAAVAAELADMQSQPLFLQADAQQLVGGTHWQPTERDAEPYHPAQHEPAQSEPAQSMAPEPAPFAEPPQPEPPRSPSPNAAAVAPIATALDAAARLAADADAAAAALESLTRMLHNHQRPASMVPAPQHVAQQRPLQSASWPAPPEQRPAEMAPRPTPPERHAEEMPPRPTPPEHDAMQMASRPARPEQHQAQMAPRPAAEQLPVTRPVRPPVLRPTPMPRDSRQFDVRGFMAGFALSWAIGAVLYIYLMIG